MEQEITTEYNTQNYLEAVENCSLITYSLEVYGEMPSTIYVREYTIDESLSLIRKKSHEELGEAWSKLAKM
jgi:hypothetical protein